MKNILLLLSSIFLMSLSECADKKNPDGTCNYSYLSDEELGLIVHDKHAAREAERKYGNTLDSYGYYEFDTLYFTNNNGDSLRFDNTQRIYINPGAGTMQKCKYFTPLIGKNNYTCTKDEFRITIAITISKNSTIADKWVDWSLTDTIAFLEPWYGTYNFHFEDETSADYSKKVTVLPEYSVGGINYYNVYSISNLTADSLNINGLLIAKNLGLVKILFNNGEEFNRLP